MTGEELWARICATVTRLGGPRTARTPVYARVAPQTRLDLHGMTVQDAYDAVVAFLEESTAKYVEIITGRSGSIRREFPEWMDTLGYAYSAINEGSFRVKTQ